MKATTADERKARRTARAAKVGGILGKSLLIALAVAGGIVILVALYQVLQYLFVLAVLVGAWLCPKPWR